MNTIFYRLLLILLFFNFFESWAFKITKQSPKTEKLGYGDWYMDTDGELMLMRHLLKPHDIVFDIGANAGEWSNYALKTAPTIKLLTFEPVPNAYESLKTLLNPYTNTEVFNLAFSDTEGTANFFFYAYPPSYSGLSSFYYREVLRKDPNHREPVVIPVQRNTLDTFCSEHAISHIDFLKIDTEGSEWAILNGAQQLLKNHHIRAIQFEYGGCYIDAKTTLKQVMQFLTQHGYAIFRIYSKGLIHIARWEPALENYNLSNYCALCSEDVPDCQLVSFE